MARSAPSRPRRSRLLFFCAGPALLSPAILGGTALAEPAPAPAPTEATALRPAAAPAPAEATAPRPAAVGSAPVKIVTSDGKGLLYLDGKLVGEGSFVGDVAAGTHAIRITREGYEPFEEALVVKTNEPLARTVTLKLESRIETGAVQVDERLEGVYGGFTVLGMFTPGGTGNSIEQQCASPPLELASCDAGGGAGGGLGGFIGYHWDPVGMELFLGGYYDQMSMNDDWSASSTDPGLGPDPARTEEFSLRRGGGVALARVRLTHQWSRVRLGFALGAGVSYRVLSLERETRAKDDLAVRDHFLSDLSSYVSPVVGFEPSAMLRLTRGTAISVGAQIFLDAPATFLNGGENPRSQPEATHALGRRGLSTPSYELASNMQIYIGPFIGMMFGP